MKEATNDDAPRIHFSISASSLGRSASLYTGREGVWGFGAVRGLGQHRIDEQFGVSGASA